MLDYVLCSAPGAPVKQALLDVGIGKDVYGFYTDEDIKHYKGLQNKKDAVM